MFFFFVILCYLLPDCVNMCMSVCDCVCESVSVWKGGTERDRKGERKLVQERLFIYLAIYLNKVHFLNSGCGLNFVKS